MKPGITIKVLRTPDEDQLFQFETVLSNGQSTTSLQYWEYADHLKLFGQQLCDFPQTPSDRVSYELGGPNKGDFRWAYQMEFEVYCYDPSGHSCIKILVDNREDEPLHSCCQFYILSDPGSINKLGQVLRDWNPAISQGFEWAADD